jgi:rubrerythrin
MTRTDQNVARDERLLKMLTPASMTEPMAEWRCNECGFDRALTDGRTSRRTCAWCGRSSTSHKRKPAGGAR